MRVAICDDDKVFLKQLEELLAGYAFVGHTETYGEIDSFFQALEGGEQYDVVLMDLDWGSHATGLSYAERLYHKAPRLPVIYVTGYNDRFAQHILLRETNLAGYLTKPLDRGLLEQYLSKVLERRDTGKYLTVHQQGRSVSLDVRRIVYLESHNHVSIIHTDGGDDTVYEKLSALLDRLPDTFVQCHKSYVVNMRWVQRLEPGHILLKTGQQVAVSRSYRDKTRAQVFRFLDLQM